MSPRAPALRLSVSLVSIAAVFVVAITSSPCRNGLKFSGGFGRQRCLMLPFLCCVIPHRSGGLGLPSLLCQLFIEGDVPEVVFFQAIEGSRSSIRVPCSAMSVEEEILGVATAGGIRVWSWQRTGAIRGRASSRAVEQGSVSGRAGTGRSVGRLSSAAFSSAPNVLRGIHVLHGPSDGWQLLLGYGEGLPEGSVFWELWLCMDYLSGDAGAGTSACPQVLVLVPGHRSDLLDTDGPFVPPCP